MDHQRIRLAVVDDHRMLLTALSEWIRSAAADDIELVAVVSTWSELLAHPGFPADVVLLDLDLRDGLPISVKLRTLQTAGGATVVMSTYSDPGVVREAFAAGAAGYIVKSEPVDTIVLAVQAASRGDRFLSAHLAAVTDLAADGPVLSTTEAQIMALYSTGESAKRMATTLHVSEHTVKSHLKSIRAKYRLVGRDVSTKVAMRDEAIRRGLILLSE